MYEDFRVTFYDFETSDMIREYLDRIRLTRTMDIVVKAIVTLSADLSMVTGQIGARTVGAIGAQHIGTRD